ncbi:monovalent cation/H(+) antiporter subunit G [Kaistia geumhonensis]|uniref:Multicomponent K+:H+ antiporter subunit G n=1 Tax=Kaistia geumhonensis TaxID=410839 RepID=A0ABU0M123_9HYPH|nr:monovalent cation/H(+) antiporter subunit G [Kaistia geumhonensis]MCX5480122.1 monovalent cation/H(+) antiporter subunit G [Kaistia geumhonensis]MDQ0514649.1 multicomponent K+:H+ antiporter subunit G [Kaistia geumhonensis]
MNAAADLPLWAAILVSFFVVFGAALTLLGTIGLVRMRTFYARVHAPTLGTTLGTGGVLAASMILSSMLQSRLVLHEIMIAVFVTVTTPVTLMLLGRAALYRDRIEKQEGIPPFENDP